MNIGTISQRYARALYEYAKEEREELAVYKNMQQLKETLHRVKEFFVIARNPLMNVEERAQLICSAVTAPSPVFERFARLVVKAARESMLLYMAYSYIEIYRMEKNVVAMKITTATPLSGALQKKIRNSIEAQKSVDVEIKNVVDESLIGGFICETRGMRLDASVSNQLSEIKKQLVINNRKLV